MRALAVRESSFKRSMIFIIHMRLVPGRYCQDEFEQEMDGGG